MAARAVIAKPSTWRRAVYAGGLLVALLAALLGAWFVSGWHDVRMRQAEVRTAPNAAAAARATDLARELRGELESLLGREVRRPYFHYQNLMHDPRASAGVSVTPSPLAKTPDDRFVLGYFQVDAKGRATTPTINDEVPELSDPDNIASNRAFRDQIVRDFARELVPVAAVVVAQAPPSPAPASRRPPPQRQPLPQPQQQVVQIDSSSYAQNMSSNQVYWEQHAPTQDAAPTTPPTRPTPRKVVPAVKDPAPVTITVSPLEWRTLRFANLPALVAVRQVQTPDGALAQGFVVDRATLTSWLAGKAGDMVAELHGGTAMAAPEIAPGWQLSVAPNPRTLARAATEAAGVARTFLIRFIVIGAIAALAAGLVLLILLRAEKLARERSQFAAAAAHELRTPLAGLQLYGDMVADGLGDPTKLKDYARRMSEEAARLGRVVSNVLGFSQLERGNLSIAPQVAALDESLRELAERAQPQLDRAGATLELDVEPELRARFDRDALARIVGNLLDNAEKYARNAEDRTIRLAAQARGAVVEIVVGDRGPGIASPASLFKPFSRGVPVDGPAGLGLGLALSQSLAQAMGGQLAYRPADGGGAELVLTLPRS